MNRRRKQNKQNKKEQKEKKEEINNIKYCEICGLQEKKYTCPKCFINYCSVECYKKHKEGCQPKIEERKEIMKPKRKREEESKYLSDSMKDLLLNDERINEMLRMKRCIELMQIVQEEGKETLHSLMYGDTIDDIIFQNFALRVLQCLGLRDEYGTGIL